MEYINRKLLQEIIDNRKLSQVSLAKEMEVSRNTIGNLIHGPNFPRLEIVYKLAHALNLTEEEFLSVFFSIHKISKK